MVRAIAISLSRRSLRAVSASSPCIEAAIPSKERARSPIWSRERELIRTEKSPRPDGFGRAA